MDARMKRALEAVAAVAMMAILAVAVFALQPGTPVSAGGNVNANPPGQIVKAAANTTNINQVDPQPAPEPKPPVKTDQEVSDGALRLIEDGKPGAFCPLKHTDVQAEISGFLARVNVTQEFTNPSTDKVEAIYTFPLPQNAAVDDMTLIVGGRTIKGLIKKREEAQQIYQNARNAGHAAALLDQERPNIFTQSVANIPPGGTVKVTISYVEKLEYDAGTYSFVYPMVVGPRYIPGSPTGKQAGGRSPDTNQVPDASRITPPVAGVHYGRKGTRAGHDILLTVRLDAGVPIQNVKSLMHEVSSQNFSSNSAEVHLKNQSEIPNRDFVLKYDVAGGKIEDALLVHASQYGSGREEKGGGSSLSNQGFFTFILQPPDRVKDEDATPRELIFVLDTSGSMSGYPIETAKKVMKRAIQSLRPGDTFNFISFAGDTHVLFPQPVMASAGNINTALQFLEGRRGGGGTEMMKAIRTALGTTQVNIPCPPNADCLEGGRGIAPSNAIRIVCFMTDGYVGNDMEIIGEVKKHSDTRVFSFGIGSSVNRFLLDKMAEAGRGEVEYVLNDSQAEAAADRFYERVHTPVLTDISIDWGSLPVADVIPARPLDLFTAKPLVLAGRFNGAANGTIKLRGKRAGKPFERAINVKLPASEPRNQALAQLWARTKIDELMSGDWQGMQNGNPRADLKQQITQLGLDYRLMTQFTSFVAVEESKIVEGGKTRTIHVPVEMPQGVSPEGVFGEMRVDRLQAQNGSSASYKSAAPARVAVAPPPPGYVGAGVGPGSRGGVAGGVYTRSANEVMADAATLSKDEQRRRDELKQKKEKDALESKLHPALLTVYECWKKSGQNKTASCAGVVNGKVKIQIWLDDNAVANQQKLAAAGFASQIGFYKAGAPITGTVAVEKLHELANMQGVKLLALAK